MIEYSNKSLRQKMNDDSIIFYNAKYNLTLHITFRKQRQKKLLREA
jgi:hypothetical protein